jgi:hypothetical protein
MDSANETNWTMKTLTKQKLDSQVENHFMQDDRTIQNEASAAHKTLARRNPHGVRRSCG